MHLVRKTCPPSLKEINHASKLGRAYIALLSRICKASSEPNKNFMSNDSVVLCKLLFPFRSGTLMNGLWKQFLKDAILGGDFSSFIDSQIIGSAKYIFWNLVFDLSNSHNATPPKLLSKILDHELLITCKIISWLFTRSWA